VPRTADTLVAAARAIAGEITVVQVGDRIGDPPDLLRPRVQRGRVVENGFRLVGDDDPDPVLVSVRDYNSSKNAHCRQHGGSFPYYRQCIRSDAPTAYCVYSVPLKVPSLPVLSRTAMTVPYPCDDVPVKVIEVAEIEPTA
jgi:hypothetical protein